jgi:DNA-binding NarL/FixJ family response regulator
MPDIVLMDINMPHMDGFETVQWLQVHFPEVKVLVVSMVEKEESILRMLKMGVRGYLSKDVEPTELGAALNAIMNKGFFYTDFITGKLVLAIQNEHTGEITNEAALNILTLREKEFLKLACSELTYGDIASQMFLSPKTIDGYRNTLFEKLKVKSRVGMALYAVKYGLVQL